MKIEPNQLCRVVGGDYPENYNAIVRTVEFHAKFNAWECEALQPMKWRETTGYVLDLLAGQMVPQTRAVFKPAGQHGLIRSDCLRPLYDGDAEDETLAWKSVPADKPVGVPA